MATTTDVSPKAPRTKPRTHRRSQMGRTRFTPYARALGYVGLAAATVLVFVPYVWMVVSSFKRNNDVFTVPVQWFPSPVELSNYVDIFAKADMITWIKNSLILSVTVTFLQVLTGSFAAYGFSKGRFPGRKVLFVAYVGTIAVPWQAYMIPQYVMFSKVHLTNTLWAIIVLQAFGALGVFLMKQFFDTIPDALLEAARIDGLSEIGIYRRIMLPLSIPAIAGLSLITFVTTWNDFVGPLVYLRDRSIWTIQLGLNSFNAQYDSDYALIMTGAVLSVVPVALIFGFGQRFFVEGIATTGVKG